jgi:molybdopterin-containing oxidoreductase family membrane subunit
MNNILANVLPQPDEGLAVKSSNGYNAAIAISLLLAVVGVAFGVHAFFQGYHHAYNVTREVPWGLLIATYVFFRCYLNRLMSRIRHRPCFWR